MADIRWKDASGNLTNVINTDATLDDDARATGDYDNSTNLDTDGVAFLTVQFNAGPPGANTGVGDLYLLPGDAEASEGFPEGGVNDTPQSAFFVGSFETIKPSTTVDETLALGPFPLYPHGNRFVLLNNSGQQYDLTWQLDILRYKMENV